MRCAVCNRETDISCICGYCPACISFRTHRGCQEEVERRKDEKDKKVTK